MLTGKPPDGWECPACKKVQGVQGFNTSQTRKCRGQGGTCTTRLCSACGQGTAKPEKECQICKDVRGRATVPVRATVQDDVAASTGVAEAEQRVRAEAGAKEAAAVAEAEQRVRTSAAEELRGKMQAMQVSLRAEADAKEAAAVAEAEQRMRAATEVARRDAAAALEGERTRSAKLVRPRCLEPRARWCPAVPAMYTARAPSPPLSTSRSCRRRRVRSRS